MGKGTRIGRALGLVLAFGATPHCGRDSGYVFKKQLVQRPDVAGQRAELKDGGRFDALTWNLPCPSAAAAPSAAAPPTATTPTPTPTASGSPRNLVITGSGPFKLPRGPLLGAAILLKGQVCDSGAQSRDVVVAVDVSGSMSWNDPAQGGSCKRLKGLNIMLDSLPLGSRMGAILFDDTLATSSQKLFDSKVDLFADLVATAGAGAKIEDLVCAAGGQSDFNLAVTTALSLLSKGRAQGAAKELVLISDGDATNLATDVAVQTARNMSSDGILMEGERIRVAIAALTISDRTSQPRPALIFQKIVSNDRLGYPLQSTVDQALPLTQTLAGLYFNMWESAALSYQAIGSSGWTTMDLTPQLGSQTLSLAAPDLMVTDRGSGYNVKLTLTDTRGNQLNLPGSLQWND